MFQRFSHRFFHYALLLAVGLLLFAPNLGGPSLWDIDEGNNAEAAREMLVSGNWIVPTFNFELRVDKPALLYWLQIEAYRLFGVNEFAARLPSALAALLTIFCTYELGRRLFGAAAGLLAGLMLASSVLFCAAAHFANPDSLLTACTALTFVLFWNSFARGDRSWFVLCGIATGLAVLAKGPVGLALPSAVTLVFLFWARQLRLLLDWRLLVGMLAFGLVMVPWYAWVGAETRGNFLKGFFLVHNVDRFMNPMEGHTGNPAYYAVVLLAGFAPWSAFLGLALWYSLKFRTQSRERVLSEPGALATGEFPPVANAPGSERTRSERPGVAFLWCWIVVYLVFFSFSRTKLPNYILPIYPAVALLTGRFLERWRRGEINPPAWLLHAAPVALVLLGIGTGVGLLLLGGVGLPSFLHGRVYPGVEIWAVLGIIPLAGAAVTWLCLWNRQRTGMIWTFTLSTVAFLGLLAAGGASALERHKAPRDLVHDLHDDLTMHEVRVGSYEYFQPSLVFYCRREVKKLQSEKDLMEFLECPLPVYLFVPARLWEQLQAKAPATCRLLARRHDLYRHCDVVVVTNR